MQPIRIRNRIRATTDKNFRPVMLDVLSQCSLLRQQLYRRARRRVTQQTTRRPIHERSRGAKTCACQVALCRHWRGTIE